MSVILGFRAADYVKLTDGMSGSDVQVTRVRISALGDFQWRYTIL